MHHNEATPHPMTKSPLIDLIRFRTTESLKKRVAKLAKRRGCDISDVVREAVIAFVEQSEAKTAAK